MTVYHFVWDPTKDTEQVQPPQVLDTRVEKQRLVWVLLSIAALPLLSLGTQYAIFFLLRRFAPDILQKPWFSLLLGSVCLYLIAMPLCYLLLGRVAPRAPSKNRLLWRSVPMLLSAALALTIAGSMVSNMINSVISLLTQEEVQNPVESATKNTPVWAVVLCMVILAPIFEELFFRKLLIDRSRRYGDVLAILLSSLAFGLIHGNISQVFYATLVGLLLGGIYCKTGKIHHTILIHMFLNFYGGILVLMIQRACGNELPKTLTADLFTNYPLGAALLCLYYAITLTALATAAPSIIYLFRKKRLSQGEVTLSRADRRDVFLKNPAFWTALAILCAYFLI